jgi:thiol-disulfide isomerase/thioredoxin
MHRRTLLASLVAFMLAAPMRVARASNPDGSLPGFDDALKAGEPLLIHVTAPWCGECRRQKPIVARLLATPEFSRMKKFDIDFDTDKVALRHYKVQHQSTIIVFKGGIEVGRLTGNTDPAVIEALMRKAL